MGKIKQNKVRFAGIPHVVMEHPDYYSLSGNAAKLLLQIAKQYNKTNNGKLCIIYNQLKHYGWRSSGTLDRAKKELLEANLITISRHSVFGSDGKKPVYYALTWLPVNEIYGFEMDIQPTQIPLRQFSLELRKLKVA